MKNVTLITLCIAFIGLGACNSSSNTSSGNSPVTGVFHIIQPVDVDMYVANYEADRPRNKITFDGVEYQLSFIDTEDDQVIASFNDGDLVITGGTDQLTIIKTAEDGETAERTWVLENDDADSTGGAESTQATGEEDFMFSGRVKDMQNDEEIEVSLVLNESLISGGASNIIVSGTEATVSGTLGTGTYVQLRDITTQNPNVTRLVLGEIDGSVNDAINVHTGRLIRAAGLATHVPVYGDVNSGGVDLFAAGVSRTVEPGGILGVHSWCCENGITADNLSVSDPAHGTQLTYFREMLPETGVDFYFFTLSAAPFDGIHAMTREEMNQYLVITE